MIEKIDKDGKAYCEVTDEELKKLKVKGYYLGENRKKLIPPPDCKHELIIEQGIPRNYLVCTRCIFWTFTLKNSIEEINKTLLKKLQKGKIH